MNTVESIEAKEDELRQQIKTAEVQIAALEIEKQNVCSHPIQCVMEYDGSFICSDCRKQWHPFGQHPDELPEHFKAALAQRTSSK